MTPAKGSNASLKKKKKHNKFEFLIEAKLTQTSKPSIKLAKI